MIVALGALLGLVGGVVTAAQALARGPKWTFLDFGTHFTEPADECGFVIKGTQLADKVYVKVQKKADGSMISLFTGFAKIRLANRPTERASPRSRPGR